MKCSGCGAELSSEFRFCTGCGHALSDFGNSPILSEKSGAGHRAFENNWKDIKQIGLLFGLFLLNSILLSIMLNGSTTPQPEVYFSIVEAVFVLLFVGLNAKAVLPLLRLRTVDPKFAIDIAVASIGLFAFMQTYIAVLGHLGIPFSRVAKPFSDSHWSTFSMFTLICIVPGVFEELAFRGVIQTKLERIVGAREAIAIQAGFFSVAHFLPLIFVSHFAMGLVFGWLRSRAQSLYPGMALHMGWNAFVLFQELQRA